MRIFKVNLRLSCHAYDWLLLICLSLSKLFLQLKFSSCLKIVSLVFRWNSSIHRIRVFFFSFLFGWCSIAQEDLARFGNFKNKFPLNLVILALCFSQESFVCATLDFFLLTKNKSAAQDLWLHEMVFQTACITCQIHPEMRYTSFVLFSPHEATTN